MVLAYHVILSCYGFWLPNDERGSWSDRVRKYELQYFGPPKKVTTRRSLADQPFDPQRRQAMRDALKYPPVRLTGEQARLIASGFAQACAESGYRVLACAIMPNHVHLVIARHERPIETIVAHLKSKATQRLSQQGENPLPRSPWADGKWGVYLNDDQAIWRAIRYVQDNPIKDGLKPQAWKFVRPWQG